MKHTRRTRERGSAMLVTLVIVAALIAGGAALVSTQLAATRATGLTRSGMSSLYCAEAGLAAARPIVANNHPLWDAALAQSAGPDGIANTADDDTTEPLWLNSPGGIPTHEIDTVAGDDFSVYLVDNDDEPVPVASVDYDFQVFIVSKCIKYPDTPKEVRELVQFNGATQCGGKMKGGCTSTNNAADFGP